METQKESLSDRIRWFVEMESKSGSMDHPSALYISRMLNVPVEDVLACL